jgi:hypothetical protein
MTYGDYQIVRKLCGNRSVSDISDAEIQQGVAYGDTRVEAETAHSGYLITDPVYPLIKQASEYFASSWVIDHYESESTKGDDHYQKAMDICFSIRESSPESLFVMSTQYNTYPLNPLAPLYRSLPGSASTEYIYQNGGASP